MTKERWSPLIGWKRFYEVSSHGHIRRIKDGIGVRHLKTPLKPWSTLGGYQMIYLCKNNKQYPRLLHRLIAATFIGPSRLEVNHIDNNKKNNAAANLEYVTRKQNMDHARKFGRAYAPKAMSRPNKLNEKYVRQIRKQLKAGIARRTIAARFGVTHQTITGIANGECWGWLR
jgi:HNH endonuclease/NUMOD4 motif